jgi:hypothetical protein
MSSPALSIAEQMSAPLKEARIRGFLIKYGRHFPHCLEVKGSAEWGCTCGFAQVLEEVEAKT